MDPRAVVGMETRQLSVILVSLMGAIAIGVLVLLFRVPPAVSVERRLTDEAAERRAGTLKSAASDGGVSEVKPVVEVVDLKGIFETLGGQASDSTSVWPGFRGVDLANRGADGVALAEQWPEGGPRKLWSVGMSEGHSGPSVWKGAVYVMDYDEKREGDMVRCFSLGDGREIWRRFYHAPTKRNHGVSRTVPAVTERFVVTMGPRCHVLGLERVSGNFKWGIDLVREWGTDVPLWYTGQCPLIEDGVAVLAPGGPQALLMGVDCETGKVLWQTPNPDQFKMSHASIMPVKLLGRRMYVYPAAGGLVGVSAEAADRGKLLWKTTAWNHSVMSPSPVAMDDHRLFLTAGYGGGSLIVELHQQGDTITAEPKLKIDRTTFSCEQQTPLVYEGCILGVLPKDAAELKAQFACLGPSGTLKWTSGSTERFGFGPFLLADNKIFILNDNGELTLIRASTSGYERLAKARVLPGRDAWAPMALVDGRLLLRDSENLVCLDVRKP